MIKLFEELTELSRLAKENNLDMAYNYVNGSLRVASPFIDVHQMMTVYSLKQKPKPKEGEPEFIFEQVYPYDQVVKYSPMARTDLHRHEAPNTNMLFLLGILRLAQFEYDKWSAIYDKLAKPGNP